MAYEQRFGPPAGQIQVVQIGNYLQRRTNETAATDALVGIAQEWNGTQALAIANMQQNDLIAQLDTLVPMTAFTLSTFTTQQQLDSATNRGIDAGHCFAIVGFSPAQIQQNIPARVTLRNPHNRSGLGGGLFTIDLAEFQLLFGTLIAPQEQ